MDNCWPHFLRDVDNPEHGGVPRNFRPQQRNPDLDPRVISSLLCDLNIVGGVSAAVNDGRQQERSRSANGDVPGVELRPRCGWVCCGEDLISLSFSVSLVLSLSLLSRFLRPREPNRFLSECGFSCCSNRSWQNRLSCGQMGSRLSFCFSESVCFRRKSNRKQKNNYL